MNNSLFDLNIYLQEQRSLVNTTLKGILGVFDQNRELTQAMTHSLMAGGKRLRPILCLAAAQAAGGNPLLALPSCCALEFIHTYSLIHDDLPAMDDDDFRRGLATCHKQFSESTAILAGDALLTHAFFILSKPQSYFDIYPSPEILLDIIARISKAAGIDGMVEGQMLDVQSFSFPHDSRLEHIKKIHSLKTGKLIKASVESGALSVNSDPSVIESLSRYAENIGLAFQIADDILNVEGDPEILGKATGSDAANDKMTFPAIIGLEQSKQYARKLLDEAIHILGPFDDRAEPLRQIAIYIINRNY